MMNNTAFINFNFLAFKSWWLFIYEEGMWKGISFFQQNRVFIAQEKRFYHKPKAYMSLRFLDVSMFFRNSFWMCYEIARISLEECKSSVQVFLNSALRDPAYGISYFSYLIKVCSRFLKICYLFLEPLSLTTR